MAYVNPLLWVSSLGLSICWLVPFSTILVPFPYASEDHQTKDAMALVDKHAAVHIADFRAADLLVDDVIALKKDEIRRSELKSNIAKLAMKNSAETIANEVLNLLS